MEIIILTKDRSSPQRKLWVDVWDCCINSLALTNLISHGLLFSAEHQRLTITRPREKPEKESKITLRVLSGPRSPQTKACVSMTTLRWDPLLAIDSSQSALSAEGGSGDKERFNSICSEWLLAPHVNGINRLYSELHRRNVEKGGRELCCHG